MAMMISWRPSPASDGSVMVRSIDGQEKISEKIVEVENSHAQLSNIWNKRKRSIFEQEMVELVWNCRRTCTMIFFRCQMANHAYSSVTWHFVGKIIYKRRSRTAILSINVAHEKIDWPYNKSPLQKIQYWQKNISIETSAEEFKPIASNIYESENRQNRKIGHFRMFSLSTFQCKGPNDWLFHLMNISKYITVNSDLDRNFKKVVSEKEKLEYRQISILIALCQFYSIRIPIRKSNFLIYRNDLPASNKKLSLDILTQNEAPRANIYEFEWRSIPRLTALSGVSGPSKVHCMDKN